MCRHVGGGSGLSQASGTRAGVCGCSRQAGQALSGESASTKGDSAGGRTRTRLLDRNSHRLDMLPRISVTTGRWLSVVAPRGQLTTEGLGGLNPGWRQLASLG